MPGFVREDSERDRLFGCRWQTEVVGKTQPHSELRKFLPQHRNQCGILRASSGYNHFVE